jgi:2-(1,2-epoxy-1,2-dihydrophenyl)acetyl-CoA isomerase
MSDTVLLDQHEGVLTLTLNQPNRLNALSGEMLAALLDALRTLERDPAIRCAVLTGAGRGFSSGADLTDVQSSGGVGDMLRGRYNPVIGRLRAVEKPLLAAVNGVAAGAGMSLALACDLRYAAESARFLLAFVNIGLVPDAGSTYFLVRLVGEAKALELAWTGDPVGAQEALALGLVNKVIRDDALLGETQALAARLARGPALAQALIKRGFLRAHELPLERVLEMEAGHQALAARDPDFAEGVAAFKEKRPANFGAARLGSAASP